MKSSVIKRSVVIAGRKTSVSLEDAFWKGLREIASERGETLTNLMTSIDAERGKFANLSSAIRLFVLRYYQDQPDRQDRTVVDVVDTLEHPLTLLDGAHNKKAPIDGGA